MKSEHEIEKDLKAAIALHEQQELKARLQQVERGGGRSIRLWSTWIGAAAAAVVLTLLAIRIFAPDGAQSGEEMYAAHFEPYPNALMPLKRSSGASDSSAAPFAAYEQGDFESAITGFHQQLVTEDNPDIRFYYAMSLQNAGQYEAALTELQRLKGAPTRFASQALWYRALLEIRLEDRPAASQTLKQLMQAEPAFRREAAEALLKAL